MNEPRAVVFDLDDTLYPYRAFVRSGLRAVACRLETAFALPPDAVQDALQSVEAEDRRGRELQSLCERLALPATLVPCLVNLMWEHQPAIALPLESIRTLRALRPHWRLGILTNGTPGVQRRKIEALGVDTLVDTVVFATDCGNGAGKPAPDGFWTVMERLRTIPAATVFVGNDPVADMVGASDVGMRTIHVAAREAEDGVRCDATVRSLRDVPAIAARLVPTRERAHVL